MMLLCASRLGLKAQTLPANTCGLVYTHDAAGNRTQRKFVCNNSAGATPLAVTANGQQLNGQDIQVDRLYPNPTTGRFTVHFTQALTMAQVILTDMEGHVLQQRIANGNEIEFDISAFAPGVYSLKILAGKHPFTYKVLKP